MPALCRISARRARAPAAGGARRPSDAITSPREDRPPRPASCRRARATRSRIAARRRAPSRRGWSVSDTDVTTAGSRGSEIVISSQPSTCELSASRISQPCAASDGVRSRSPTARPMSAQPIADASVASKSGPAGPTIAASALPQREQEAGVREPGEHAEDRAERRVLAVGALLEHAGDEDRRRRARPGSRSSDDVCGRSRQSSHAMQPDEHDLRVAEHRREPGADLLDRVVPEHEVGREERAREPGEVARARCGRGPQRRSSQRAISQSGGQRPDAAEERAGRRRDVRVAGRGSPRTRSRPRRRAR